MEQNALGQDKSDSVMFVALPGQSFKALCFFHGRVFFSAMEALVEVLLILYMQTTITHV